MDVNVLPSAFSGKLSAPPSKSVAHRAIIAAALAHGESIIRNVDLSSDIRATIGACQSLGCTVRTEQTGKTSTLTISGGPAAGDAVIDCAESGSTLRFFIPVGCAFSGKKTFTGRGRLPQRPISAYLDIFRDEGIAFRKPADKNLPLTVSGTLRGGDYTIGGGESSQYITGLLLALPLLLRDSTVTVTGRFESRGYVDLTVDVLRTFGVQISVQKNRYIVRGNQAYTPCRYTVEGDYSQAAFYIVGGTIAGDVVIDGLSPGSLQPDRVIVDIMRRMGADITHTEGGLHIGKSVLRGVDIDVSQCPDLVPPLAVAAAFADGETRITGAARLRIKESDRLRALGDSLQRLGVAVVEKTDGLIIRGGGIAGGEIDSFGDHRIAMAFSIAAAGSKNGILIHGAECVDKSYPGFFGDFCKLGGRVI